MADLLYIQLADRIAGMILERHLTGRLPGMLRLASEFRVHHKTVGKAFRLLEKRGLVTISGTSGTYVISPEVKKRTRVIGLIGFSPADSGEFSMSRPLEKLADKHGYSIMRIEFNEKLFNENERLLFNFPVDGFLFRGSSIRSKQFRLLCESGMPFFCFAPSMSSHSDTIEFNHASAYRRLLAELTAKGYRKIAFAEFARTREYQYYIDKIRSVFKEASGPDFDPEMFFTEGDCDFWFERFGADFRMKFPHAVYEYLCSIGRKPEIMIYPCQQRPPELPDGCPLVRIGTETPDHDGASVLFDEQERMSEALLFLMERCDGYTGPFRHPVKGPSYFDLTSIPDIKPTIRRQKNVEKKQK